MLFSFDCAEAAVENSKAANSKMRPGMAILNLNRFGLLFKVDRLYIQCCLYVIVIRQSGISLFSHPLDDVRRSHFLSVYEGTFTDKVGGLQYLP